MKYLAQRLRAIRYFKGHSMSVVQHGVGISKQSISKFEKGLMNPTIDTFLKLANFYDVPIDFFFKEKIDIKIHGEKMTYKIYS